MSRPKRPVSLHRRNLIHVQLTATAHRILMRTANERGTPATEFVKARLLEKLKEEELANPLCAGALDSVFGLPLTDDEQRLLRRVAKTRGVSASAYVREFVLTLL